VTINPASPIAARRAEQHPEPGLSTAQFCDRAGISTRQADYWLRAGWLVPSVAKGEGIGSKHRWSDEDVVVARVVDQIPKGSAGAAGMEDVISAAAEMVRAEPDAYWLILTDRSVRALPELADLGHWASEHPAGRFLVLCLARLREEADSSRSASS
jgi:hypothetical protein